MKNIRINGALLLIGMGVLFQNCSSTDEKPRTKRKKAQTEAQTGSTLTVGTVSKEQLSPTVQLPGELKAYQEVEIYPRASGFVEKVLVDRGSMVRQGQVLMVLDAPETEERLVAARSQVLKAEAMLTASKEHYRRLVASNRVPGSVSALDLETAQARMRADSASVLGERANIRALAKLRDYLTVRAPFDGMITERNVHPGALVGSGAKMDRPMLILKQQNRLRLVADVPEAYNLREGTTVQFTLAAMPGREFAGKISRRGGSLNEQFRSETVEIDVPNPNRALRPGMFAELILPTGSTPGALTVPKTAIVTSTERQYVIRVENGKTQFVPVRKGNVAGEMTEVFGQLKPDDRIITNARDDIQEGIAIR